MADKIESLRYGQRATLFSIVVSFVLAVLKATVGFFSGAMTLVTDALDSTTDIVSSLASYFGLKLSEKKPDERFNYGYYKAESLASLFIAAFIIYGAIFFMIKGYERLFLIAEVNHLTLALAATGFSAVAAISVSIYLKKVGTKINSSSLIANSKDRLKDFFASIAVFISLILSTFKIPYVEGIVIIALALLILRIGLLTVKDAIMVLMDSSPKGLEEKVVKIIKSINGVEDFKDLRLRKAGPFVFGEVDIKVIKSTTVLRAHEIAERTEQNIINRIPEVDSFSVHIEPFKPSKRKIALPIKKDRGLNSEISKRFLLSPFFIFLTLEDEEITEYYVKKNPYKKAGKQKELKMLNYVLKEKPYVLIAPEMGEGTFHTSRDHLLLVFKSKGKTVKQAIENLIKGKLKFLEVHK